MQALDYIRQIFYNNLNATSQKVDNINVDIKGDLAEEVGSSLIIITR